MTDAWLTGRRRGLGAGVAGLLVLGMLLLPLAAKGADQPPDPQRSARFAQKWEDILLLGALRHLRLTPAQLQQMLPLARLAEERLARLRVEEERALAGLERLADRQQAVLAGGKRASTQEQANALTVGRAWEARRARVEDELVQYLAPRFARILRPEQVRRGYLLTHGQWPESETASPALLDPGSGFVARGEAREQWRNAALSRALSTRYPRPLIDSMLQSRRGRAWANQTVRAIYTPTGELISESSPRTSYVYTLSKNPSTGSPQTPAPAGPQYPEALREAAWKDLEALRARWDRFAEIVETEATPEERGTALGPLTRRLFLSSRLKPVLTERLQHGGGN